MGSYGEEFEDRERLDREENDRSISRRALLGAAAFVGGGAAVLGGGGLMAQAPAAGQVPAAGQAAAPVAPVQENGRMTGTRFRALVNRPGGAGLATETLTMRGIHPLQVVLRMTAAQTCYTTTAILGQGGGGARGAAPAAPAAGAAAPAAGGRGARGGGGAGGGAPVGNATGHGGVGIVEQVGSQVRRVRVGDTVIMSIQAHCGTCANCLAERADLCNGVGQRAIRPEAVMADGTPVNLNGFGYSELLVCWEEAAIPVWTTLSPAELSLFACVTSTGLGMAMCRFPVVAGTDVVVFGLGPVGMSALQGARIQGAGRIIGVDPIKYRRDLAMKLGATAVVDSNAEGANLATTLRNMTNNIAPAGRQSSGQNNAGANYVLEAVGGTRFPPTVEAPTDMTGVQALQDCYAVVGQAGVLRTCSIAHPQAAQVSIRAGAFSNGSVTHAPGNFAGVQPLRDIPRFVKLAERGLLDLKSMIGVTMGPDKMREAVQVAADRSAITSVVVA
jgi:S-(hydroxymethyl)glutathione dehydrogenase / alcohol dehydrogenase